MAKTFPVTIMTKPYLKKYLHTLYGNPLVFTIDNLFGITVSAFLFRTVITLDDNQTQQIPIAIKSQKSKEEIRLRVDKFDTPIEIHFPITFLTQRRGGFELTDQHIITVNKFFEKNFEDHLWKFCLFSSIKDIEKKEALELFCKDFNIEIDEDCTMDGLKKKEERYNNKMKETAPHLSAQNFNARTKYQPRTKDLKKRAPRLSEAI